MRRPALVAGVVAAAVGLGVAELLGRILPAGASPLDALGGQLVAVLPGGVLSGAIELLGSANRPVLTISSVAVALAIGAWSGALARARIGAGIAVHAVVAVAALLALGAQAGTPFPIALLIAAGALGASGWVLVAATDRIRWPARTPMHVSSRTPSRTPPPTDDPSVVTTGATGSDVAPDTGLPPAAVAPSDAVPSPTNPPVDRRGFLRVVGVGSVLAIGTGVLGRVGAGGGAGVPTTDLQLPAPQRAAPALPAGADLATEVDGVTPLLTPTADFYRIDTAFPIPRVDVGSWSLRIDGLVERPRTYTMDDLLARDLVEVDATIACVSNEVGGDLIGSARWLGVPLAELLAEVGPTAAAEQVFSRSVDGWTAGFPLEVALDGRDALVAIGMNGTPLPPRHGAPARLIVPGLYGYVSATKWLEHVELTPWDGVDGYWVPRGWSKEGPVKIGARIDVPADAANVPSGETVLAGMAWAPIAGIRDVEIAVDDRAFESARLATATTGALWRGWRHQVTLDPGEHRIRVRAIDESGNRQPQGPRSPVPDGAEGWHEIRVTAV